MDTMTVKKRKKTCILCCGNDVHPASPKSDSSEDLKSDSQEEFTRPANPAPFERRKRLIPSILSRIGKFFRQRYVLIRVHIELRKLWKGNPKMIGSDGMIISTNRKQSILPVPSLSVISEKVNEGSEGHSTCSFETKERKGTDNVPVEEDFAAEKYSSCNVMNMSPTTSSFPVVSSALDPSNEQPGDQEQNNNSKTYLASSGDNENGRTVLTEDTRKTLKVKTIIRENPENVLLVDQEQNNSSKTYLASVEDNENGRTVFEKGTRKNEVVKTINAEHPEKIRDGSNTCSTVVKGKELVFTNFVFEKKNNLYRNEAVTTAIQDIGCKNSNAQESGSNDSFDEGDGKLEKRNKLKKVTFREEAMQQSSIDAEEETLYCNQDFYNKEHSVFSEKIHPAVSKRADKLKSEKNFSSMMSSTSDEFGREIDNFRKKKQIKKVRIDTMNENFTECFRKNEQPQRVPDRSKGPSEGLHFDREPVLISSERPIMKVRPIPTRSVKVSGQQSGKTKKDRRKVLAETSGDKIDPFKLFSSKKCSQDEFIMEKLNQFEMRSKKDFVKRKSPYPVDINPSPVDAEHTGIFVNPNNSAESSNEDMVSNQQDTKLDEIDDTKLDEIDIIEGLDSGNKGGRDMTKYQADLSKIIDEKEPHQKKTKKLKQNIYDEEYVDYKPPSRKHRQNQPLTCKANDYTAPIAEYDSSSDECDIREVATVATSTKKNSFNTIIIPKPPAKSIQQDIFDERGERKRQTRQGSIKDDEYSYNCPESTSREQYTADDLIQDIDSCLAEMKPKSAPPRPRNATLAPNPFPVFINNLPNVCTPKKRKTKKKKKEAHNPLLAGVEDHPTVQRISAPNQLGKLKEVTNRNEPTPEVFLRTGKKNDTKCSNDPDPLHINKSNPLTMTTLQQPIGKLNPKGKDSSMVDVKVFTHNEDSLSTNSSLRDPEGETSEKRSSLYPVPNNVPKNLTSSQKQCFSQLQCTFRAVEKNLPCAKFWTDLFKGNIPNDHDAQVSFNLNGSKESDRSSISPWPMAPIGYGGQETFDLGISDSDAELNRLFFSKVVSKPQFYKKSEVRSVNDSHSLVNNTASNEEPNSEDSCLPQNHARNQDHSNAFDSKSEETYCNVSKSPQSDEIESCNKAVSPRENPAFFGRISENHNFFQSKDGVMEFPRSYFNEPPLGAVEEMPGRRHSKEDENLQFFLSVSRNSTGFFKTPSEGEPVPPCIPHGYHPHKGYIPDDPDNYVDENTAKDNLKFFKNVGKSNNLIEKPVSLRERKKKRKKPQNVLLLDNNNMKNSEISTKREEENLKMCQDIEDSAVQGEKQDL